MCAPTASTTRSTRTRSCSSPASRASRPRATSRRSAAAARTRPPSRSPPPWAPTCARSTPTSPACSAPTRGSFPTRASCRSSRSRRCSRWSSSGAGVLQLRSRRVRAQPRRAHPLPVELRRGPGTVVVSEEETMEHPLITAVTHSTGEARVTLTGVPDTPGIAGRIFTALADANVNVDMIIQNEPESEGAGADMSFTVPRDDLRPRDAALGAARRGARHRPRDRRRDGQGVDRRRRDEVAPGRRREGVPRPSASTTSTSR